MVYLPPGSLNLFLMFGLTTLDFLFLSFSTIHSSSLWRTDTIFFAKLNKPPPPPSNKTPSLLNLSLNAFERNKTPPGGGIYGKLKRTFNPYSGDYLDGRSCVIWLDIRDLKIHSFPLRVRIGKHVCHVNGITTLPDRSSRSLG